MDFNYPYLLVLNNDNIKTKLAQPLLHTQRIKYTCFDVSEQFLIFGATSGGLYVFKRSPCEFIQLMPYQEGVITNICISPNEKLFAFTTLKGLVCILEYNGVSISNNTQVYHEHVGNIVTAIKWNFQSTELYVGDNIGKVSVVVFSDFIAKTMFQSPCFTIMNLDSQIVQIDVNSNILLASTLTRSYICDTMKEQYRQIGKKLREGEYGACFLNYNIEDNINTSVINDNYSNKKHIFSSVSSGENSFTTLNFQQMKIFCARPGFRFWEISTDGTVIKTHQFKQALSINPSKLITLDNSKDTYLCVNNENDLIKPHSLQFSKLLVINNKFLLTFHSTSLYIFDPEKSSLVLWSNCFNDIMDVCVINNNLYIWRKKGGIDVILFVELENFILHCYLNKQYLLCANLCIENMDYLITHFPKLTKLHLLSGLEEKLKENASNNLYEKMVPFITKVKNSSETRSNAQKFKNGIFIIDNAHFTESQLSNMNISENKDNSVLSTEAVGTLKEISNTVSDKLINSTKSLKEKWQVFEEKFKTLATDTSQSQIDSRNEQYKVNEIFENIAQDDLPIIVPLETQVPTLLITEECEKVDPDLITLYEYYKLSKISKVSSCSAINNIIMKYKTASDLYDFLKFLKIYMNENNSENGSQMWCYNLFLQYLNIQNSEKSISIVLADSELKQYLLNAFVEINYSKEDSCECNFPLSSASKRNVMYEKVGRRVIRLLWEINPVETIQICGKVPYMWKYIALLKKDILNILIQYNDIHLLESHLSNLFDVIITDVIDMFIELKHDKCLNCKKENVNSSLSLISWSSFCTMLINRFGNVQTIDALLQYSEMIPPGELDYTFYQLCIVSSAFTKKETDFKQKFFDLKNSVLADEKSANKLEQMVENILLRRSESSKNNCRNPFTYK